jgi:hypothetical protein
MADKKSRIKDNLILIIILVLVVIGVYYVSDHLKYALIIIIVMQIIILSFVWGIKNEVENIFIKK